MLHALHDLGASFAGRLVIELGMAYEPAYGSQRKQGQMAADSRLAGELVVVCDGLGLARRPFPNGMIRLMINKHTSRDDTSTHDGRYEHDEILGYFAISNNGLASETVSLPLPEKKTTNGSGEDERAERFVEVNLVFLPEGRAEGQSKLTNTHLQMKTTIRVVELVQLPCDDANDVVLRPGPEVIESAIDLVGDSCTHLGLRIPMRASDLQYSSARIRRLVYETHVVHNLGMHNRVRSDRGQGRDKDIVRWVVHLRSSIAEGLPRNSLYISWVRVNKERLLTSKLSCCRCEEAHTLGQAFGELVSIVGLAVACALRSLLDRLLGGDLNLQRRQICKPDDEGHYLLHWATSRRPPRPPPHPHRHPWHLNQYLRDQCRSLRRRSCHAPAEGRCFR